MLLSLGTNLGDRVKNLKDAISRLNFLHEKVFSSIYESKALLPANAPASWDQPFLTMVVFGSCLLAPKDILKRIKNIERELGRDINSPRWSPRIIDIDVLLIGNLIYNDESLKIPHPEFLKRSFVIIPAQEVASHLKHPVLGAKLKDLKCNPSDLRLTNHKI